MDANNTEKNTDQRLLEFLIAEFETTLTDPNDPRAVMGQEIVDRYKKDPYSYSKSDLYKLDTLILSMQPTERLMQRAETLRLKYADLAGTKIASVYHPAPLPSSDKFEDKASRNLLLADLQYVLRFIHWSYFFIPIREKIRNDEIIRASFIMLGFTIFWAVSLTLLIHCNLAFFGLLITVVYAGLMGGFISSQRRMQMIPTQGDPLSSIYELENGRYFSWFAPLTGAVFSVILMLLFVSGVVSGSIFPKFDHVDMALQHQHTEGTKNNPGNTNPALPNNQPDSASSGTGKAPSQIDAEGTKNNPNDTNGNQSVSASSAQGNTESAEDVNWKNFEVHPVNIANYALLILWSFIAGFAERFVPDALDRLISRGASAEVGGALGGIRPGGVPAQRQVFPPLVKFMQPPSGPSAGGTEVKISGTGFKSDASVSFGSIPANTIVNNETQITAISPPGEGIVNVTVTSGGLTSPIDPNDPASQFTYVGDSDDLVGDESDSHICDLDVPIQDITSDEELPIAKGGVA